MTPLTPRQAKFVDHYALCGNSAEAARLAGYSAKTARVIGPENLLKPAVKQALEARQQAFRAELGVTKQEVVSGILSAIQMGREQRNPAVMIQGCVQLARLCGFYEPEVRPGGASKGDVGALTNLQNRLKRMSEDELLALHAGQGCCVICSGS